MPRRRTNLGKVGLGPTVVSVSEDSSCLDIFSLVCHVTFFSFSLGVDSI